MKHFPLGGLNLTMRQNSSLFLLIEQKVIWSKTEVGMRNNMSSGNLSPRRYPRITVNIYDTQVLSFQVSSMPKYLKWCSYHLIQRNN